MDVKYGATGCLLLAACCAIGERLPLKTFTVADGLAHDEVNKIFRDSHGLLWFCTAEGLSRFDGYSFVTLGVTQGLPHSNVNDILETKDGDYWVATDGGLARLHRDGTPAKKMFSVVLPDDPKPASKATSVLLGDGQGALWVGTWNGLYRLEERDGRFSLRPVDIGLINEFPEQRLIADLIEDRQHSLWIATPAGLYRRWPDGSAARYTVRDGLPSDYLHCLLLDHQGRLWAGTRTAGFFCFRADQTHRPPEVDSYARRVGVPKWVFQLFETSDGHLWAAGNKGFYEYFPDWVERSGSYRAYTAREGISFRNVSTLCQDGAGNLWLGTLGDGAARLTRGGFVTYDKQDGIASANAIFEDRRGALCFRGYSPDSDHPGEVRQFFGRFDGQMLRRFLPAALRNRDAGWVSGGVTLQARNGEWWVGTGEGLFRFPALGDFTALETARPQVVYAERDGLTNPQVFRLFEDSQGGIWVSTISSQINGLARWEPDRQVFRSLAGTSGLSLPGNDLAHSFAEDGSGAVWIGFSGALARYRDGHFHPFTSEQGLPPGIIEQIHLDRAGRLWLASSRSGLIRVDDLMAEQPVFTPYSTLQGLSSNSISVITEDVFGRIYAGSGRGLDRLDPATGHVKHFTTANGLPSTGFLSAFCDRSGVLWFGTLKGLSRFVPTLDKSPAPPILVTGLRIAGSARSVPALGGSEFSLRVLNANENHLQIDFVGVSFVAGETLRYTYKLEGADAGWSPPGEFRTVNYVGLGSGAYRFLVRAENSDGTFSPVPASVIFEILPPVWRRWWFLLSAGLFALSLAYALHRYRVRRLLEIQRVRIHIAADLHDDIGSNLTQIAILSEVAQSRLQHANAELTTPLSSIARISRESVASMSDIVWAINPKRDRLTDLVRRMRRLGNETLGNRGIQVQFAAPDGAQDTKLGAEVRHHVFLVFKEALHNAVRHSACSKLDIELRLERSGLMLRVTDDGRGFDPDRSGEGQGLGNMRRRAANLGGELQLRTTPAGGTEVELRVPL
jgi:ligand-binding sensor domain-containing protein/two-component sensor histidine kinase